MADREKTIKGLECCGEDVYGRCRECPYNDHRIGTIEYCTSALCVDALKLLKEQEETIASLQGTIYKLDAALKDRPDIVRCKDCKHYGYHNMTNVDGFCYCLKRHEYPHPDWFCADGERRDQDD